MEGWSFGDGSDGVRLDLYMHADRWVFMRRRSWGIREWRKSIHSLYVNRYHTHRTLRKKEIFFPSKRDEDGLKRWYVGRSIAETL